MTLSSIPNALRLNPVIHLHWWQACPGQCDFYEVVVALHEVWQQPAVTELFEHNVVVVLLDALHVKLRAVVWDLANKEIKHINCDDAKPASSMNKATTSLMPVMRISCAEAPFFSTGVILMFHLWSSTSVPGRVVASSSVMVMLYVNLRNHGSLTTIVRDLTRKKRILSMVCTRSEWSQLMYMHISSSNI